MPEMPYPQFVRDKAIQIGKLFETAIVLSAECQINVMESFPQHAAKCQKCSLIISSMKAQNEFFNFYDDFRKVTLSETTNYRDKKDEKITLLQNRCNELQKALDTSHKVFGAECDQMQKRMGDAAIIPNGTKNPKNGQNVKNNPERDDIASEISVIDKPDTLIMACEEILRVGDILRKQHFRSGEYNRAERILREEMQRYLRTREPVSVSLEKCAEALARLIAKQAEGTDSGYKQWMESMGQIFRHNAKAVLNAAGVKYVD